MGCGDDDDDEIKIKNQLDKDNKCFLGSCVLALLLRSDEWYNGKWDNKEKDMKKLSEKFPTVLFELECHGEKNVWLVYYKGTEELHTLYVS